MQPAVAVAQRTAESTRPDPEPEADDEGGTRSGEAQPPTPASPTPRSDLDRHDAPTRFFGSIAVSPERYGRDFARIAQEVITHLAAAPGTSLEISVEIHATNAAGFETDTVRTVRENSATLKFGTSGFESEQFTYPYPLGV